VRHSVSARPYIFGEMVKKRRNRFRSVVAEDCEFKRIQRMAFNHRVQPVLLTVNFDSGFVDRDSCWLLRR